ncbi:MAG: Calx-beta domain-containing protein, partial [Candidatus Binatia bacterium]
MMKRTARFAAALLALLLGVCLPAAAEFPTNPTLPPGYVTPDGSAGAWTVVTDQVFEGVRSVGSAKVLATTQGVFVNSDISATSTFLAGTISFMYRISSHQSFSSFTFAIDGATVLTEPGGESGWKVASIPVTAGSHTLRWRFSNSLNATCNTFSSPPATGGAACTDRAWIDALVLPLGSTISMSAATQSVLESSGVVNIVVARTGNIDAAASLNYSTADGTALAGSHYTATSGTLNWAACDGASRTIAVPIINNTVINSARTFTVALSAPTGASVPAPSSTAVTIDDDDNTLQFSSPTYNVTEGTATVTLSVTRSGGGGGPASVTWTTANGTAVAGSDFGTAGSGAQPTGTLNWAGGDGTAKSFTVAILNDAVMESAEAFTVVLSNPTGSGTALGSPSTATVTINDDESGVTFAQAAYTVNESGPNITVTVN